MAQSKSTDRIEDPLLAFAIESRVTPAARQPSTHPDQPVATAAVSPPPAIDSEARHPADVLCGRIDSLEKAIERSLKDINLLKADVATLVGVTGDIRKQIARQRIEKIQTTPVRDTPRGATRIAIALAAVVLGVIAGAWFWINMPNDLIVPPRPPATPEPIVLGAPLPDPSPPVAHAAIVPVAAAVTPAHESRSLETDPPVRRPTALYVGTLTIDSDPAGEVLVDRKSAGRTPLRLPNLKAGSHLIWIERDGYRRFTRVVRVPSDRVTRLVADLEPAAQR